MFGRYMVLFTTEAALKKRIQRELIEARNELMTVEATLEQATHHRALLAERVERLRALANAEAEKEAAAKFEAKREHDECVRSKMPPPRSKPGQPADA